MHEEAVSVRIDLGARLYTRDDGLHRRHNKGRPSITRYAHWVPGRRRRSARTSQRCGTHDHAVFAGSAVTMAPGPRTA